MNAKKRVNIVISEETLKLLDEYVSKFGSNRSATVSMIVSNYLEQREIMSKSKDMPMMLEKLEEILQKAKNAK